MHRATAFPLGTADAPTRNAFAQPASQEEDALSQASCIFSDVVTMRIKLAARDEYVAAITVRLRPDNAVHPRNLLLELTDEQDLFFYHSLLLGEGDFHTLKSEQRLLVDFQSFPLQLVDLLRRCMDSAETPVVATSSMNMVASSAASLRMLACLDCSAGGESTFSIIESNQFRELTHIGLRLRQGTDETVKKHLAAKLKHYRTESADLAERLRVSEEAVSQLRRQVEDLTTHSRAISDERNHLEQSLVACHQRELAELRQEHANAIVELQQAANQERSRIESELQQALSKMTSRADIAERSNEDLHHQQQTLTASEKSYRERLDTSDVQLQEARREVTTVREQLKQLELLKFRHEREIGERDLHIASFKEQLSNKEQLVANQTSQLDQATAQRKSIEDSLSMSKQQVNTLEEKFGLSAQEIAKGNQIIQKLRNDNKQFKAKLRLKAEALSQQEKSLVDVERAEETGRHLVEEKAQELLRGKEREERQRQDIEDLKRKLAEAHEVLKSNHDVIEYLNRQLTERDLKSLPPVMAGPTVGSDRETHSTALSDLLKRTEALSTGLKPMGLKAGSAISANATAFNMTGLSELGFGSGARGLDSFKLGSIGQGSSFLGSGLMTSTSMQPSALGFGGSAAAVGTTMNSIEGENRSGADGGGLGSAATSSASAAASIAAGRDPLTGPVAYRSPATTAPIAVK
jgi:spindle assembly abnormal protein 6